MDISFEKIFFLILLLLLGIGGAEFAARNSFYAEHNGSNCIIENPLVGKANEPNCQYEDKIPEASESVSYKINSCGFRDERSCESYSTAKFRLYGLGDSYTFGHASAWRETYVMTAETWLAEASKSNLIYINGGVNGWNLLQYTQALDNALKFQPTAVTMAISPSNLNGIDRSIASESRANEYSQSALINWTNHQLLKSPAFTRWGLVSKISSDSYLKRKYSPEWEQRLTVAKRLLSEARDKLKNAQVPLIVILIPQRLDLSLITDSAVIPELDSQAFSKKMASILNDLEIPYVDFMAFLKNKNERLSYYYPLDKHLTPAGQKALGEYVANQLFFQQSALFLPPDNASKK